MKRAVFRQNSALEAMPRWGLPGRKGGDVDAMAKGRADSGERRTVSHRLCEAMRALLLRSLRLLSHQSIVRRSSLRFLSVNPLQATGLCAILCSACRMTSGHLHSRAPVDSASYTSWFIAVRPAGQTRCGTLSEKSYRLSNANRVFLWMTPAPRKRWRWAYEFEGRETLMSFGKYPIITLADARARRDQARKLAALQLASRSCSATAKRIWMVNRFSWHRSTATKSTPPSIRPEMQWRFQRVLGIAGQKPGMKLRGDSQAIASVSHVRESLSRKASSIPALLSDRENHRM